MKAYFVITLAIILIFPSPGRAQTESGDTLKSETTLEQDTSDIVYQVVEENASFPGGMDALMLWLSKNLIYPSEALDSLIQGTVYVKFIVAKDGSITDVKVARGVHPLLDDAAVKVVLKMPRWSPGKQLGKPVRSIYFLPISFQLEK